MILFRVKVKSNLLCRRFLINNCLKLIINLVNSLKLTIIFLRKIGNEQNKYAKNIYYRCTFDI